MATKEPKIRSRYSIGEWYGRAFESFSAKQRHDQAKLHAGLTTISGLDCPFQRNRVCNKKGGVCSLRKYEQIGDQRVTLTGPLVTTCPNRFLENDTIFTWVGQEILGTKEPIVLGQVGFLDRLRPVEESSEEEDSRDFIGRIDNVLVHPTPDWRSSGPKRLLPQLQTKVPTIRTWGKKMAVVIDEAFFGSLVGLEPERHLSNAEIVWFIVKYELKSNRWKLKPKEVVFSQLDTSVKALTGGVPLSKEKFEAQLEEKLHAKSKR